MSQTIEILANLAMKVSDVKKNPMALANEVKTAPVVMLNHNKPIMYCLSPAMYAEMLEKSDDALLHDII